jgi:hypothetical protein
MTHPASVSRPANHRRGGPARRGATGTTVHDCRAVLSLDKGAAPAIYGFVEGTKTAPFPVAPADTAPARAGRPLHAQAKRLWYKRW